MTSQNVLLSDDGRVKVADFGIARIGASALTRSGMMMGTSHYLSPEQARGLPADERSDIYGAGVVLFEMLTGRVPFAADSDVAVALKHVNEAPPRPRDLEPAIPRAVEQVVLRALAKDPDQRFQTAAAFAAALARFAARPRRVGGGSTPRRRPAPPPTVVDDGDGAGRRPPSFRGRPAPPTVRPPRRRARAGGSWSRSSSSRPPRWPAPPSTSS